MTKIVDAIRKNEGLIATIKAHTSNTGVMKCLRCIEADFVNYHGPYCQKKPGRFVLHLIKSILYQRDYRIYQIEDRPCLPRKYGSLKTNDYIYDDNIYPVTSRLEDVPASNVVISSDFSRRIIVSSLFSRQHSFSVWRTIRHVGLWDLKSIMSILYIRLVLIPNCLRLISMLRNELKRDLKYIISPDVGDNLSRAVATVASEKSVPFIVLQCGPYTPVNTELRSVICDEFIAWPMSKKYFDQIYRESQELEIKYFIPPRFYACFDTELTPVYDAVIFLPWLSDVTSEYDNITQEMCSVVGYLRNTLNLRIAIKHHPAVELEPRFGKLLPSILDELDEIDIRSDVRQVIAKSRMVVNWGSTVSFDADLMGVKCAVINLHNRIPNDSIFFELDNIKNVRHLSEIGEFWLRFDADRKQMYEDFTFVDHLRSKLSDTTVGRA